MLRQRPCQSGASQMTAEKHTGGCVCGAVRYETEDEPVRVSVCCCRWCQKRTGSALGISVYFDDNKITFNEGPRTKFRLTSDAGRWIETEFCTACGSTVTWTLEFNPGRRGIAGGTFDCPSFWYTPERLVFARTKPDWVHVSGDIEVCETLLE